MWESYITPGMATIAMRAALLNSKSLDKQATLNAAASPSSGQKRACEWKSSLAKSGECQGLRAQLA